MRITRKKFNKGMLTIFASLALIGTSASTIFANNTNRVLNSNRWATAENTRASASHSVNANATHGVNGLRVRVSVSTGQASNWVERAQSANFVSGISAGPVTSTSINASATGQYQYRRQGGNWITLANITH